MMVLGIELEGARRGNSVKRVELTGVEGKESM